MARGSSSTRAPCGCWASGATARTNRRSGRARDCDSSRRQARAVALGCAHIGPWTACRIQAAATSSAPAAVHALPDMFAGASYLAVPASRAALLASVQGSEAARRSSGGVVLPLRISSYGRSAEDLSDDDLSDDELLHGLLQALEARLLAASAPTDGASSWRTYEADGGSVIDGSGGADGEDAGYSLEACDLGLTLQLPHAAGRPAV